MNWSRSDWEDEPIELSPRAMRIFGVVVGVVVGVMVLGLLLVLAQGAGLLP